MTSSRVMMAEAVAVRPSPDMSATCRVRLYTATTWGTVTGAGSGGLGGHLSAWGRDKERTPQPQPSRGRWLQAPCLPKPRAKSCMASGGPTAQLLTQDSAPTRQKARGQQPNGSARMGIHCVLGSEGHRGAGSLPGSCAPPQKGDRGAGQSYGVATGKPRRASWGGAEAAQKPSSEGQHGSQQRKSVHGRTEGSGHSSTSGRHRTQEVGGRLGGPALGGGVQMLWGWQQTHCRPARPRAG